MDLNQIEKLISEFKYSLKESKDFFVSISIEYKNGNLLSDQRIASTPKYSSSNLTKLRYMAVAIMCSDWESLRSRIGRDFNNKVVIIYGGKKKSPAGYNDEISEIFNLRDCIMHHTGLVDNYHGWHSGEGTKYQYKINDYIEDKMSDNNTYKQVSLNEDDISNFFNVVIKAVDDVGKKLLQT